MEHIVTARAQTKTCHFCRATIEIAHAREGNCYCCEVCYLRQSAFQTTREITQHTMDALVEMLVAALNAREHETSLHSKRGARLFRGARACSQ